MKTLLLSCLTALNLLLGTATGNTESAHGRAVPSDCQRQESESQKGNGIRGVCTRLSEKQKEPSSTDVFLVSYDKPQTILSSTIKGYVKQPNRAYVYVNENMYAINFGSNKSITPISFTPVHASDRLSPLITVGSLSRSDPFVSNVIENAGSCYYEEKVLRLFSSRQLSDGSQCVRNEMQPRVHFNVQRTRLGW